MSPRRGQGEGERALRRAEEAYDEGRLDQALELAGRVPERLRGGWLVRALAHAELGELETARAALEEAARREGPSEDQALLWALGELELRAWRLGEARRAFERLQLVEHSPELLSRLALLCELEGDFAAADRLLEEAGALDPEGFPPPPRLSEEQFEEALDEAIGALPERFQALLARTQILVAPVPSRELIDLADPSETPPDLMGLFLGSSRADRSEDESLELPPLIYLFQRNLERACLDREELVDEIGTTLYHEFGHLLGFDEEGVAELGLE